MINLTRWMTDVGPLCPGCRQTTPPPASGPLPRPTLTLGVTVHAVGIAADVSYRLQGHGLTLARQSGLGIEEDRQRQEVRTRETQPSNVGAKPSCQQIWDEGRLKQPLLF